MTDDSKVPGPLDGADFRGTSKSLTVLSGGRRWETCRNCGSVIYPQRLESTKVRQVGRSTLSVEKFRCRCGVGREIRRELAA